MSKQESLLSFLSFDCLEHICRLVGRDVTTLVLTGDALLLSKLKLLKSVKVVLGNNGGFETYSLLYSLLTHFTALQSLIIKPVLRRQMKILALKPEKLPTSLTSLKLSYTDAVVDFVANDAFFQALPHLLSLKLDQPQGRTARKRFFLSLAKIPSSLRCLSLTGISSFISISPLEFKHLPTLMEEFYSDGVVETKEEETTSLLSLHELGARIGVIPHPIINGIQGGIRIGNETYRSQMELNRFTSLYTLLLNIGPSTCMFADDYPSTITKLDLEASDGGFLRRKSWKWNAHFPSLQSLYLGAQITFTWKEFLELPVSMRYLTASFQDWKDLTEEDQLFIFDSLASRNESFDAQTGSSSPLPLLIVPSLLIRVRSIAEDALTFPIKIYSLFTGLVSHLPYTEITGYLDEAESSEERQDESTDHAGAQKEDLSSSHPFSHQSHPHHQPSSSTGSHSSLGPRHPESGPPTAKLDAAQGKELTRFISSPKTKYLSISDCSARGVVNLTHYVGKGVSPSLVDFTWTVSHPLTPHHLQHFLTSEMRYKLRFLTCYLDTDAFQALESLDATNSLSWLCPNLKQVRLWNDSCNTPKVYESSLLSDIIPHTVNRLTMSSALLFNAPLALPHLTSLILSHPIPITDVSYLPPALHRLAMELEAPIDITNEAHKKALLSFPRSLKVLYIGRGPQFSDQIKAMAPASWSSKTEIDWYAMGFVLSKTSFSSPISARHADECQALELMTRNLHLIELLLPFLAIPKKAPLLPRSTVQIWMRCSIPFYALLSRRDPDPFELCKKPSGEDAALLRKTVDSLLPAKISYIGVPNHYLQEQSLTAMYQEASKVVIGDEEDRNFESRKSSRSASLYLCWYTITLFHILSLIFYGLKVATGQDTLFQRIQSGSPLIDFESLYSVFIPFQETPTAILDLFRGLSAISSILTLILCLVRLKQHSFSQWSLASIIPPHRRWIALLLLLSCFVIPQMIEFQQQQFQTIIELVVLLSVDLLSTPRHPRLIEGISKAIESH